MSRIHDLAERRRRLWTQGWERWLPDFEARINRLSRLLEEAYADKRRENSRKRKP